MKRLSTKKILEPLAKQYGVIAVLLFGSQAKGETHPLSDVDIGIVFKKFPPEVSDIGFIYADFEVAAKKIYGNKEVDIVFLQETPLSLQYHAISEGELIFVADPDAYANYIEYVLKYYFDFLPVELEFHQALIS